MVYTVTIDDSTEQASSFINFVKTLAHDYNFLHIEEDDTHLLTHAQELELNRRFEYVVQNPEKGKSWEEIENNILK